MPNEQLASRAVGVIGRVDLGRFARNEMNEDDWERLSFAAGKLHTAPLYLDEQPSLRLLDVRNKARAVKRKAGGLGLNLTAAHIVLRLSNDYSLRIRLQSDDRVHRPGQTSPVSYFDRDGAGYMVDVTALTFDMVKSGTNKIEYVANVSLVESDPTQRTAESEGPVQP